MKRPSGRLWHVGMLLGAALGAWGCARVGDDGLVIASAWSRSERRAIEVDFRRWADADPGASREAVKIHWISLARGDDLARIAHRRAGVDVVLGGPASAYTRMARAGVLAAIEPSEHLPWRVVRRSPIGLSTAAPPGPGELALPSGGRGATFDDPRHDPLALAWAKGELGSAGWAEGYARLVRDAAHPRRIGRQAGSALAALEHREVASTPAIESVGETGMLPSRSGIPSPALRAPSPGGRGEFVEGVAILRRGGHRARAQTFLKFLAGRGQADPPSVEVHESPEADTLLADLLGATLVDAQDELRDGWEALESAAQSDRAERWMMMMTQAPPWPPASVEIILRQDPASALPETLASQLAPDADVRAWLLQSWLRPTRQIDGAWLAELAGGAGGRLVREPRFRAWLRAEWRAWSRQRYRRVARLAESVDRFDPAPAGRAPALRGGSSP